MKKHNRNKLRIPPMANIVRILQISATSPANATPSGPTPQLMKRLALYTLPIKADGTSRCLRDEIKITQTEAPNPARKAAAPTAKGFVVNAGTRKSVDSGGRGGQVVA